MDLYDLCKDKCRLQGLCASWMGFSPYKCWAQRISDSFLDDTSNLSQNQY